jgi:hypothetical protein
MVVGAVFQAVGVALPPNLRVREADRNGQHAS